MLRFYTAVLTTPTVQEHKPSLGVLDKYGDIRLKVEQPQNLPTNPHLSQYFLFYCNSINGIILQFIMLKIQDSKLKSV